jgi:hypothetical protein
MEDVVAATTDESLSVALRALLEELSSFELAVRTYEEAGVLTYDKGLVVWSPSGAEFQLTVVRSS